MSSHSPAVTGDRIVVEGDAIRVSEHRHIHVDPGLTDVRGDGCPSLTIARQGAHLHHSTSEATVVEAGSALLYRADAPFRLSHPFLRTAPDVSLYLEFGAALLDEVFGATAGPRDLGHPLSPAVQVAAALLATHAQADDALGGEERGLRLLDGVARELLPLRSDPAPAAEARRRIGIVREAVAAAPDAHHRLAELAALAGCSPFHLTRLFRRLTGLTLGRFRLHLRLARALQLIADGGDDLTAVAHAAGFSDHAHMSNSLRRIFGTTPSALREKLGGREQAALGKMLQAGTDDRR